MKRIVYVLRSALDIKSSNEKNIIHADEFVADFEVVYPSNADIDAIELMIQNLMANIEEKELLEKYNKEKEFTPFIVRNTNNPAVDFIKQHNDEQAISAEKLKEQHRLFPPYQLR